MQIHGLSKKFFFFTEESSAYSFYKSFLRREKMKDFSSFCHLWNFFMQVNDQYCYTV